MQDTYEAYNCRQPSTGLPVCLPSLLVLNPRKSTQQHQTSAQPQPVSQVLPAHLVQVGKAMTVLVPPVNNAGVHVSNWQRKVSIQLIARKIIVALGWCNITNDLCSHFTQGCVSAVLVPPPPQSPRMCLCCSVPMCCLAAGVVLLFNCSVPAQRHIASEHAHRALSRDTTGQCKGRAERGTSKARDKHGEYVRDEHGEAQARRARVVSGENHRGSRKQGE